MVLRRALWKNGFRYRIHYKIGNCKPDIIWIKQRIAVFVDGCFWHMCPECYKEPKSNQDFWREKINKNVERDQRNTKELIELGWKVIRIWEHEIKKDPENSLNLIISEIDRDK